jgi:phage terminase small subunit
MRKLTLKQKKFVKYYFEADGNGQKAAEKAGYTPATARIKASQNLNKPIVREEIRRQLEGAGLTEDFTDEALRTIIESGVKNRTKAKVSDAVSAIRMVNELKDRFPAQRHLTASLNLNQDLQNKTVEELKDELNSIQEANRTLLSRIENT